jgi:hypothetical protein
MIPSNFDTVTAVMHEHNEMTAALKCFPSVGVGDEEKEEKGT